MSNGVERAMKPCMYTKQSCLLPERRACNKHDTLNLHTGNSSALFTAKGLKKFARRMPCLLKMWDFAQEKYGTPEYWLVSIAPACAHWQIQWSA